MNDTYWMKEALKEAAKADWNVHPNPMVGAIIVRDGLELGRGYHHACGQAHAELEAIEDAQRKGHQLDGATIYVTLEPCNHFGKTPPCTEALIRANFARCVVASMDWDPRLRGSGFARLREAGIVCEEGLCHQDNLELNAAYFKRTRLGLPYVTAKWAMSADGRIATRLALSQWITGPDARKDVHLARARHDAILVGTQTIIEDNPQLNVRLEGTWRQPLRIVLDRQGRIPENAKVFQTQNQKTVLFTSPEKIPVWAQNREQLSLECVDADENGLDIKAILETLVQRYQITTLYCEGGATLLGYLHDHDLIDAFDIYIAPKIIGGKEAKEAIAGLGIAQLSQAHCFHFDEIQKLGQDLKVSLKLTPCYPD